MSRSGCAVLLYLHPHRGWPHATNAPLFILRPLLLGLAITLGCAFFGILLSRIIREPNVLLPVALVAMPIDYLGAMTPIGFTQNAVAQQPEARPGAVRPGSCGRGRRRITAAFIRSRFIGPGDALFMAFFFAVVLRLDLNVRGTFWWMYGLLTATMLVVLFTGINIAALIPMGLAVLIANRRVFQAEARGSLRDALRRPADSGSGRRLLSVQPRALFPSLVLKEILMTAATDTLTALRRVVLLETDERAGLVAALAAACAAQDVSLDIVTGPGHVLITFDTRRCHAGTLAAGTAQCRRRCLGDALYRAIKSTCMITQSSQTPWRRPTSRWTPTIS